MYKINFTLIKTNYNEINLFKPELSSKSLVIKMRKQKSIEKHINMYFYAERSMIMSL